MHWKLKIFSRENDLNNAYLDIQSGSGGTEAQDWAEMLFRMYSRWAEEMNFKVKIEEYSSGDVAGIKSASIHISGTYAYGWLRTETGIHRLVRKSPFDSGNRRHTSFAAVFVSPEIEDDVEIELDIRDCHQIYKALVFHSEKGTFSDEYDEERTNACKDFFYRMILEYKYKVE